MTVTIHTGDSLSILDTLPSESVNCVVTSPPYFGLRNYLDHPDQLGQEPTVAEYVANMVAVFAKLHRVLKKDGTAWLNLGDGYAQNRGSGAKSVGNKQATNIASLLGGKKVPHGFKEKDLLMMPARVAIALQDWGWYLRSEIVWHKTSAMPESVKDRPTKSHEMIYLLTKSPRYWYDADAVREPHARLWDATNGGSVSTGRMVQAGGAMGDMSTHPKGYPLPNPLGANMRDVWSLASAQFKGSHFATFPAEIPRRCILAGCPVGGTVLDPFGGAGTTGLVADRNNRNAILIELNPEYVRLAKERIYGDAPMFAKVDLVS